MKVTKGSGSVWDDIIDDPEEAALMKAKSLAFNEVRDYVLSVESKTAIEVLGATAEQFDLIRHNRFGRIDEISLETLENFNAKIPK